MCDLKGKQAYVDKLHQEVNEKLDSLHLMLSNEGEAIDLKKFNVLVVEDNVMDVKAIRGALEEKGVNYHLNVVNTAEEAIAYLERETPYESMPIPDLIIIDIVLPKMDGEELHTWIRKQPHLGFIPTMIVSSDDKRAKYIAEHDKKMSFYVPKPIDSAAFISAFTSLNKFWFVLQEFPSLTK